MPIAGPPRKPPDSANREAGKGPADRRRFRALIAVTPPGAAIHKAGQGMALPDLGLSSRGGHPRVAAISSAVGRAVLHPSDHSYRPEIDGLRAFAILPVLLFHFDVPGFAGGFVGVDIFFVISGFLIGGILWKELTETGRVRLLRFFSRRVRRLAPAYFVMALTVLAASCLLLLPFALREAGKELIAATTYLSNVYFFLKAGYFDSLAEEKLLLHTWSLSVEEQFYLVLPPLLILLAGLRRHLPLVLGALALVSLAACIWMTRQSQTAAFYLFPFRAWELLAGVLLAIVGQERRLNWSVHPALSWVGMALLLAGVALLQPGPAFPGAAALIPVTGTVLLLANGRDDNAVNRMLVMALPRFFGLISYSLYLWHWPVVVLAHYVFGAAFGPLLTVALLGLSVLLGALSAHWVETPIRRRQIRLAPLFATYLAVSGATLAAGAAVYLGDGFAGRFGPEVQPHIRASRDYPQDASRCHIAAEGPWRGLEVCAIGPDGPPRMLVWGDSHLRVMRQAIDVEATAAGMSGVLIWRGGCPPLAGVSKHETVSTPAEDRACRDDNRRILEAVAATPSLDRLLLVGRWNYYVEGAGIGRDLHNRITLTADQPAPRGDQPAPQGDQPAPQGGDQPAPQGDDPSMPQGDQSAPQGDQSAPQGGDQPAPQGGDPSMPQSGGQAVIFAAGLRDLLAALPAHVRQVFVLQQVPEMPLYGAEAVATGLVYGRTDAAEVDSRLAVTPRAEVEARSARSRAILSDLAAAPGSRLRLLDLTDGICDARICRALHDGVSYYFDNNHLTHSAAMALRAGLAPAFAEDKP